MHRLPIVFFILFISSFMSALPGTARQDGETPIPTRWGMREAVDFALQQNPDITLAVKRIEQAKATAELARAADYPVIGLSMDYSQTDTPMYSFGNILNQSNFDNSIDFNDPGRTDNLQLKALLRYRLYNGGRDTANLNGAQAMLAANRANLRMVHNLLGFEVVKAYQAIVQADQMVKVRQESLEAIEAALQVGRARYEAGDLLKQDLLNLELQVSRAQENLIRSTHTQKIARKSFLNLLGLTQGDVVLSTNNHEVPEIPEQIDLNNRAELQRLLNEERAATARLEYARAGKYPTVDALASYQIDKGFELDGSGDSWLAGLRINYTLFDGNATQTKIMRASLDLERIREQKRKLELSLNLELQRARLNFEQARQRLEVTEKMVKVAMEVARLSRERFQQGIILASDLIDHEMRLSDAKARRLAAQSGYLVAIADLRRVAGMQQFPSSKASQ